MPLCFPLSQIPLLIVPFGSCRILRNTRFPSSFSIKHIYVSILKSTFWGVLHSFFFFFFLIALFAFSFLNFHGLHGCVCRGYICVYTHGLGFLHVWVPWTYDPHKLWEWLARPCFFLMCVLVLSKKRMLFRKEIALQSSYQLIWESRFLPLSTLVGGYNVLKEFWAFHALKDLHREHDTRSSFGFPLT